jgi:hypothetical protein
MPNPHLGPTPEDVTPTSERPELREKRKSMRKGTDPLYRLTVFVRHENVLRLLEFLGYR